jgi:hypothetical protein
VETGVNVSVRAPLNCAHSRLTGHRHRIRDIHASEMGSRSTIAPSSSLQPRHRACGETHFMTMIYGRDKTRVVLPRPRVVRHRTISGFAHTSLRLIGRTTICRHCRELIPIEGEYSPQTRLSRTLGPSRPNHSRPPRCFQPCSFPTRDV